jgi:hypothetical protein
VSRLVTSLHAPWEAWRDRRLDEEDDVPLDLDGVARAVRCAGRVVRRVVLAVVGVAPDGQKRLIALELAASESEEAWKGRRAGRVARGLKAPRAATIDGCPGLRQARAAVWPSLPVQRCMVHNLRNLLATAPRHAHDAIRDDFHAIVSAATAAEAAAASQAFETRWAKQCQRVVESLREAGAELLTVFRVPKRPWQCLRTTNGIARLHEECRRRVKPPTSLPHAQAVLILRWGLMASGQLRLRRIDGWQGISAVMAERVRQAASYPRLRPNIRLEVSRLPDFHRTRDTTPFPLASVSTSASVSASARSPHDPRSNTSIAYCPSAVAPVSSTVISMLSGLFAFREILTEPCDSALTPSQAAFPATGTKAKSESELVQLPGCGMQLANRTLTHPSSSSQ